MTPPTVFQRGYPLSVNGWPNNDRCDLFRKHPVQEDYIIFSQV